MGFLNLAPDSNGADGLAEQLVAFPGEETEVLVQYLTQALAILLFIAPLMALFIAIRDRTDAIRPGLIGLTIAGPLFFAGSLIALYFALDAAAGPFLESPPAEGEDRDDAAGDIFSDQSATSIYAGLDFAGRLGIAFILVYVSLYAMRTGLMTRFWGTLGMALGVASVLLGAPAVLTFFLAASLLVGAWWPGGRPPAWNAGVAIPWQKRGEQPEPVAEEPADPEDFEGSATEVDEPRQRPARRDNKRKRKRKQR